MLNLESAVTLENFYQDLQLTAQKAPLFYGISQP
jgi:hypothetical protein